MVLVASEKKIWTGGKLQFSIRFILVPSLIALAMELEILTVSSGQFYNLSMNVYMNDQEDYKFPEELLREVLTSAGL